MVPALATACCSAAMVGHAHLASSPIASAPPTSEMVLGARSAALCDISLGITSHVATKRNVPAPTALKAAATGLSSAPAAAVCSRQCMRGHATDAPM
eukprot:COSAG01_NODE_16406_length_1238_cov_1.010526_2_plen_97_part_00